MRIRDDETNDKKNDTTLSFIALSAKPLLSEIGRLFEMEIMLFITVRKASGFPRVDL
jgi:hypothetical protein